MSRQAAAYIHEAARGAQPYLRARPETSLTTAIPIETTKKNKQTHPYALSPERLIESAQAHLTVSRRGATEVGSKLLLLASSVTVQRRH
jgi:hypothetical protein